VPARRGGLFVLFFGSPPPGSFFVLDNKEAKNQGLELLSDKFVKAFKTATQAAMKNRRVCVAFRSGRLKLLQML